MQKRYTITCVIALQLVLAALYIHTNSLFVSASFKKQRLEKQIMVLAERKKELTHTLAALHNPTHVKQIAQQQLHMKTVALNQIKTVTCHV